MCEGVIFIFSNDITNDENEIIKLFNINCKLDTGREFFLAQNDLFVLNLFLTYFNNINNNQNNLSIVETNETNETSETSETNETNETSETSETSETNETSETSETSEILKKTCPTCNKFFQFPSRLKIHLQNTIHCKKTDNDIKKFFNKYNKNNSEKVKCEICNLQFSTIYNLNRHINN